MRVWPHGGVDAGGFRLLLKLGVGEGRVGQMLSAKHLAAGLLDA